jgi:hypothetical protein
LFTAPTLQKVQHRTGIILEASKTSNQAEPEEQGTTNQEQNGHLPGDPARIVGQEEEEETAEQHTATNTHKSTKPILKGQLR